MKSSFLLEKVFLEYFAHQDKMMLTSLIQPEWVLREDQGGTNLRNHAPKYVLGLLRILPNATYVNLVPKITWESTHLHVRC